MSSDTTATTSRTTTSLLMSLSDRPLPPIVSRVRSQQKMPTCVLVVGMAGSGKTTLLTQLQRHLDDRYDKQQQQEKQKDPQTKDDKDDNPQEQDEDDDDFLPAYCVNVDPATIGETPYDVSIDIRDTVNYQQVMEQHQLGPNGAIMTSLNLFCTKFDQVLGLLEQRAYPGEHLSNNDDTTEQPSTVSKPGMDYILVDTPGQIEAFTWSASGQIMSEALASAFPTVLCFVVDTARCASSPNTFMSNMLYACSMLYRTRLPIVICFNKSDVVSHEFCLEWMRDYETFQQALDDHASDSGFYGSLTRSLSLVLDEFYSQFVHAVGVSAVTGQGLTEFFAAVDEAANRDFIQGYVPDLEVRIQEQAAKQKATARRQVQRLQEDLQSQEKSE